MEVRKSPKQTENMHRMGLEYLLYLLIYHTCKNPHHVVGNMLIYCMGLEYLHYLPTFTVPYIDFKPMSCILTAIPPVPFGTSLGFPALQDTSEEEPTLDVAPLISDAKVTSCFEQLVGLGLVGGAAVGRAWLRIWGVLVACKQVTTLLMERNPANQSDMSHALLGFIHVTVSGAGFFFHQQYLRNIPNKNSLDDLL